MSFTKNLILVFILSIILPWNVVCLQCLFERRNQVTISCSAAIYKGENCTSTNLKQLYLEMYGQKLWPERPHRYELQPFDRQYSNGYYYPGIKVTLSPPATASVLSVKGFEINFHDTENPGIEALRCLIIDLRNITLTADDKGIESRATVDIYPISAKTFIFDIYSLPKPPADQITRDLHYLSFVKINRYKSSPLDPPDQWTTTIFYRNISASKVVEFIFSPPPKEYNFFYFDVKLLKIENPGVDRSHEIRKVVQTYVLFNQTLYRFENITPGFYRVSISPHDHLFNTPDCVCKNRANECTNNCFTTVTGVFQIRSLVPVLSSNAQTTMSHTTVVKHIETTGIPASKSESLSQTSEEIGNSPTIEKTNSGQDNRGTIIGVTTSVVSLLTIICITMILIIRVHRWKNANSTDQQYEPGGIASDSVDAGSQRYTTDERRLISTKTIHIAFAKDHALHYEVVNLFAKFLSTHAYCEILSFSEEYSNILNNIEDADRVLIVNSEVAFQHYKAWKDRESLLGGSNTGGNFLNSYRVITKQFQNDPFFYQGVFKINFDYTNYHDENMGAVKQFELMRDMHVLLRSIHDVSAFQDCSKSKEWIDLQIAILNASKKDNFQCNTERIDSGNYSGNEDSVSESWKDHQDSIFQQVQEHYSEISRGQAKQEMNGVPESDYVAEIMQGLRDANESLAETVPYEEYDWVSVGLDACDVTFIPPDPSHLDISSNQQQQEIYNLNQRNTPFVPDSNHQETSHYQQQQEINSPNHQATPFIAADVQTIASGVSV